MLGLSLALSALTATWAYPGFVADPPTRPAAAPVAPPIRPTPTQPGPLDFRRDPSSIRPVRFQMVDAAGQAWEHTDSGVLRRFVGERDAQLARMMCHRTPWLRKRRGL